MEAIRPPPFTLKGAREGEQKEYHLLSLSKRPNKQYIPAIALTPTAEGYVGDTAETWMGYLVADQYFNNIIACPDIKIYPDGPKCRSQHLRTILQHFSDPSCNILTDEELCLNTYHISCLPPNYPWLFTIEIFQEQSELQTVSIRHFFRNIDGEVGSRPYVEVTKQENLDYLATEFEDEKSRQGLCTCNAEEPWGHFEHWKRQYAVRFLKRKQTPNPVLETTHFVAQGTKWSDMMPNS